MNETQRSAAERLADAVMHPEAAALLRELAAEPVQEPVAAELPAPQLLVESAQGFVEGWTRSQVRSAINLALLKRRYAAPQQRTPLSDEVVAKLINDEWATPDVPSAWKFARAIERAHGITGEPT